MADGKRKATARKKTTAKKTTAKKAPPEPVVQEASETQSGPVRVPAGGIDPRLAEEREMRRAAERGVAFAPAATPATLDPKLAEIREQTKKREAELANRSLTKPPARTRR